MRNPDNDKWEVYKITAQTGKEINKVYGYEMKDWKESGLFKASIIKCNREDIQDMDPEKIKRKIGDLTERDLSGFLIKLVKVQRMEQSRDQKPKNDFER